MSQRKRIEDALRNGKRSSSWLRGCRDRWEITALTRRENKIYYEPDIPERAALNATTLRIEHINWRTRSRDHRASSRLKRNRLLRCAAERLSDGSEVTVSSGEIRNSGKDMEKPRSPGHSGFFFRLHGLNAASRPDDCAGNDGKWRRPRHRLGERRHVDTL